MLIEKNKSLKSIDEMDLREQLKKAIQQTNKEDEAPNNEIFKYDNIFELVKRKSMEKIEFQKPILEIKGFPLLYPKSILIIQGSKGVHKSRFAETLASAFINRNGNNILGLTTNTNDFFVSYNDTERNLSDQLPYAIQNIKARSGYNLESFPDNLYCTSFVNTNRNDRLKELTSVTGNLRSRISDKHLIMIIDVLTDFVGSFNNVYDSLQLTDFLNDMINRFDCSIIGVIHQNPTINKDKARGHLGTEAVNKASSVIQIGIEKDSELISLNYLALRGAKLPKDKIFLKYDDTIKGLNLADESDLTKYQNFKNNEFFEAVFKALETGSMNQKDLSARIEKDLVISKNTVISRLKNIVNNNFDGKVIGISRSGNQNIYYIKNSNEDEEELY